MDAPQDTTFVQLLDHVPDPRHGRGKRHHWRVILTLISAAIAAGCATPHAIAQMSREVTYGMTDLPPLQAGAVQLEQLWQAHWTIENRSHYVRDVTLGEDRGQAHTGSTAHALPLGAMGS